MRAWALALLALAACVRKPPARVEPCSDNLSGVWRAPSDARFRYRVTDDGKTVRLEPLFAVGGTGTGYGPSRIELHRTGGGPLTGFAYTTYTQDGKTCPIRFAERIESCRAGQLTLSGETQFDVQLPTCQVHASGAMTSAILFRE